MGRKAVARRVAGSSRREVVVAGPRDLLDPRVELSVAADQLIELFADNEALNRSMRTLIVGGDAAIHSAVVMLRLTHNLFTTIDANVDWAHDNRADWNRGLLVPTLEVDTSIMFFSAPTIDAHGFAVAALDRARGLYLDEPPHHYVADLWHGRTEQYVAVSRLISHAAVMLWAGSPIERLMQQLGLNYTQLGEVMGASRQAASRWVQQGSPHERQAQLAELIEVANTLEYRLRDGLAPIVFRRPAAAYDGKSMYDMFAAGRGADVVDSVRTMFDFRRVA